MIQISMVFSDAPDNVFRIIEHDSSNWAKTE